jgi:hypothetical protein
MTKIRANVSLRLASLLYRKDSGRGFASTVWLDIHPSPSIL